LGAWKRIDGMKTQVRVSERISYVVAISTLTLISSLYIWFPFFGTRAAPMQHFGNVVAGVLLGPAWGVMVPLIVGTLRIAIGVGTFFAYPGGIPGAITVGLAYRLTRRFRNARLRYLCAFAEPLGTVFIGGTISILVLATFIPTLFPLSPQLLGMVRRGEVFAALALFWSGWAASSIPGSAAAYLVLLVLDRVVPDLMSRIVGRQE
jgi:energy coupling factor transporter S component ThiW